MTRILLPILLSLTACQSIQTQGEGTGPATPPPAVVVNDPPIFCPDCNADPSIGPIGVK